MEQYRTMSTIIEKIKSLRNQPADYPGLVWVILVFFGSAINALAIKHVADYVSFIYSYLQETNIGFTSLANWQEVLAIILLGGIATFLLPIGYSLLYSSSGSDRKLIPPLYMQVISFGLLAFFFYNHIVRNFPVLYVLFFYVTVGGLSQDSIVTFALGKSVSSDHLIQHSFLVSANIEKVRELVTSKQFQRLYEVKPLKTEKGETIKLRTDGRRGFILTLELREEELSTKKTKRTILNMVAYNLGYYSINAIEANADFSEWAAFRIDGLRNYLSRHLSVEVKDASIENVVFLREYVMDDMAGYISRFQEMATRRQVLLLVSFALIAISAIPFAFAQLEVGFVVLLGGIALLAEVLFRE